MTQAKIRFSSFEEYLAYDDGTEQLYELLNGELVALPPESGRNFQIANFLFAQLLPLIGYRRLRGHGLELQVRGEPQNRFPDFTVLQEEHIEQLQQRNTVLLWMVPPLLVVEVVSPGEASRSRDYTTKREQYENRGVPEYWIIDPQTQIVTVLELDGTTYREVGTFQGDQMIQSPTFSMLTLTATQIFSA
ncbi:Uma2 family endonuclease [Leptolyngbya sp. AN03gr2]|uniref:Uma2 family endonuclease n=1 Tax=unclassified Leptolyngbya TaxID=2650499 RepID=UPI003D31ABBD